MSSVSEIKLFICDFLLLEDTGFLFVGYWKSPSGASGHRSHTRAAFALGRTQEVVTQLPGL